MLSTDSPAYFPLLIKSLLRTPLQNAPETEIVSAGLMRYSYRDFDTRLKTLASGLAKHGIGQGDVVAVIFGGRPCFLYLRVRCDSPVGDSQSVVTR